MSTYKRGWIYDAPTSAVYDAVRAGSVLAR